MLKLYQENLSLLLNRNLSANLLAIMRKAFILTGIFLLINIFSLYAQTTCNVLGQNPGTAFPVCGTSVFTQSSVAECGDRTLISKCTGAVFTDKNPYWYKFTCFTTGSLGFVITPNNSSDDYDWQLFDITNRNPANVYTDLSMFVACNWSGEAGTTGASAAGTTLINCDGPGVPLFSSMPTILQGHEYLLLISHFTNSQSGYSLAFQGGSGVITDPTDPHLLSSSAACDGTVIRIKLNKKMKCQSLSANGSEFTLNTSISNIISASGNSCSYGFDTDSITLILNNPLPAGNYTITIQNGSDGNTLKDNCNRSIPLGESIPLVIYPVTPTPMDSLTKPGCAPQTIELVFRKPMRCNSIASNGSDFVVTGSYPVSVIGASGICSNGLSSKILVQLNRPLQTTGNFQIKLVIGTDGNTIIDECGQETPAGAILLFNTKDTVNANFTYNITLGCEKDIVNYFHNGNHSVNSWRWTFDDQPPSTLQNPSIAYTVFGTKPTQLIVSNGTCSDTLEKTVFLRNTLNAAFEATEIICPGDKAFINNNSIGDIRRWEWDFANGNSSNIKNPPPQTYMTSTANYDAPIKLVVENDIGCKDTAVVKILIVWNCYIAVPGAFTPNQDGLNDYLYPVNAYKALGVKFSVYNRFGQKVFYTENWKQRWDGTFKGQKADSGTYVWILSYTHADTHQKVEQKGTTVLIR